MKRPFVVLPAAFGLGFCLVSRAIVAQVPPCGLLERDPASSYCFARTVIEALGRLDRVETAEAALARAGKAGFGDVRTGTEVILAMRNTATAFVRGQEDLAPFTASPDTMIAKSAQEGRRVFTAWINLIHDVEQDMVQQMNDTLALAEGAGSRAARMADLNQRRDANGQLLMLHAVGVTFTLLDQEAGSGHLNVSRAEIDTVQRAALVAFAAKSPAGSWWGGTVYRRSARVLLMLLGDPGWVPRPS